MYARYVPPSKTDAKTETKVNASTQDEPPRPGAYNRYVPPAKPAAEPRQHKHFGDETELAVPKQPPTKRVKLASDDSANDARPSAGRQEPEDTDMGVESVHGEPEAASEKTDKKANKTKEKKSKEKKDTKRSQDVATTDEPVEEEPIASESALADAHDENPETPAPAKPKKEKKKKKPKDSASGEHDAPSDDDEIKRRHKSVLERKQKSMKAPQPPPTDSAVPNGTNDQDVVMGDAPEALEAHGLEPLPQPALIPEDTSEPTYQTLPPWLAEPIRVSGQARAPFTDFGLTPELGITPETSERLAQKGYKEAFAIQTAVIPQLLPHHCRTMHSDILVSAATGSGKTLAYALPMIRDLGHGSRHVTRLRALVVLPTRELVRQAHKICEECAGVFGADADRRRVKIGTATGNQTIQEERKALLEREDRYDPDAYAERQKRLESRRKGYYDDEVEGAEDDEELAEIRRKEDKKETLPDYVIGYKSRVDILICTPGRLVEHIKYTPGFRLDYVRWLVADEADKLLGQGFQQWLDLVIPKLQDDAAQARQHKQTHFSGVRKVILSATMTRDLDLLEGLKLRRPKLVVLEGSGAGVEYALPELLRETALKADNNLKPLFLLDLLQSSHLTASKPAEAISDITSSSGSDSESDSGSDSESDSDSDTDSSSDSDSESAAGKPSRPSSKPALPSKSILIFTNSNQSALRLSRLLCILSPPLEPIVGLLTSDTAYSTRKQTLQAFSTGKIRIIVASDLVARGIDLPHLEHVVNYDMPSSVASYVHRVGRTARAGRSGHAWTFFTDAEARWFWKDVASDRVIRRSSKVERLRVTEEKEAAYEDKKARYEEALEALGNEAADKRRAR
ncbi:uncharacterized protein JN550_006040 [Neoarthrinium moseri]|uniref:uncharacterized protein n=1 Tax=Neoarthrinium moseri TaxID=1658444 RepID=UPI001FDB4577|nr:uncharacterized protein JN550_006040 [Neoarthrinium moseri]KAI1869053.1 hypothetical protein JN550_006040 [Neoarthrinium moseri]